MNGDLIITEDVYADDEVYLEAGSHHSHGGEGAEHFLRIDDSLTEIDIESSDGEGIYLVADRISIAPVGGEGVHIEGNSGFVQLEPYSHGRTVAIDDDATPDEDPTGELRISNGELSVISAAVVRVGDLHYTGDLEVRSAVGNGTGWNTLSLLTSECGGISQEENSAISVTNLLAIGGEGGVDLDDNNAVTNLAGASLGDFYFYNTTSLTVTDVDTDIGCDELGEHDTDLGYGVVTDGGDIRIQLAGGEGMTVPQLTVNSEIRSHDLDTGGEAAPMMWSGGHNGGRITLIADNMDINDNVDAGTGPCSIVSLETADNDTLISLGANDDNTPSVLGLEDSELDYVTARHLRIGGEGQRGKISVINTITQPIGGEGGEGTYGSLTLWAGGEGGQIGGEGLLKVSNLALIADDGIGVDGTLHVEGQNGSGSYAQSITVAFDNGGAVSNDSDVHITSNSAMRIDDVDFLCESENYDGDVTLLAQGPMVFGHDVSAEDNISASTFGNTSESTGVEETITVESCVTIESEDGDVSLISPESITLGNKSHVKANSTSGTASIRAGVEDSPDTVTSTVPGAALYLNGMVEGFNITLEADVDIALGGQLMAGGTVMVTSEEGAILDGDTGELQHADPTAAFGGEGLAPDIKAAHLILNAKTGIGHAYTSGAGAIETQVGSLIARTDTGGIYITNGVESAIPPRHRGQRNDDDSRWRDRQDLRGYPAGQPR